MWFTGLSGAGKTTLARALCTALTARGIVAALLDGDHLRTGLCRDLGFSDADRRENIRRSAEVARLFADAGLVCLTALISPTRSARAQARAIIGRDRFLEIHLATPLRVCEARDVKGLYRRARAGEIPEFTGISSPYESPRRPALRLDTTHLRLPEGVQRLVALLAARGMIRARSGSARRRSARAGRGRG